MTVRQGRPAASDVPSDSWVDVADGSPFPVENLPYGVFSTVGDDRRRVGVAIGDHILDLAGGLGGDVFDQPSLNPFMARGRPYWAETRERITEVLTDGSRRAGVLEHLYPSGQVQMYLPIVVGDYVDFYSSLAHAERLGRIFRPDGDPLTPNWRHLPIGYHGRAGTVVVSGTEISRPGGQQKLAGDAVPTFGPSRRLDFEAEVGFVVGGTSELGIPLGVDDFEEYVFGVVLLNDWSARDIQAWEYVPLGPFLGKSFATSISPWVVPLAALAAARVAPPEQDPQPLAYLAHRDDWGLDLTLEVSLNGTVVSRPPFADMYWTPAQQLAHMTANGASVRCGDLFASGTVSGPSPGQEGSLIELTWNGTRPLKLDDGSTRSFLEDGDVVSITASAPGTGDRTIGLGPVAGGVGRAPPLPAQDVG